MKVWVVTRTYFNGEGDSTSVAGVFSSEEAANAFCKRQSAGKTSSYSDTFDVSGSTEVDSEAGHLN